MCFGLCFICCWAFSFLFILFCFFYLGLWNPYERLLWGTFLCILNACNTWHIVGAQWLFAFEGISHPVSADSRGEETSFINVIDPPSQVAARAWGQERPGQGQWTLTSSGHWGLLQWEVLVLHTPGMSGRKHHGKETSWHLALYRRERDRLCLWTAWRN